MTISLTEKLDPGTTALLVVDVQNDFCAPGGYMHREGHRLDMVKQMVPRLKSLVGRARSAGVRTIFFQANYATDANWYLSPAWLDRARRSNPAGGHIDYAVCKEGEWGFELYDGIAGLTSTNDIIMKKHRYSGFVGTELDLILRSRGIRTVVVTGVATNVCVESTARDAFMRDYYVILADDCCATYSEEEHRATLHNIATYFGEVVSSVDVIEAWQRTNAAHSTTVGAQFAPPNQRVGSGDR